MKAKHNWYDFSLKHKVLTIFLPLTMIPLIVILVVSISLIIKNGKAKAIENASDKLLLVTRQTDQILSNIEYNIKAFSTSSALQNAIYMDYPQTTYGDYMFSTTMHASIYNIMDIPGFIATGYVHTFDGKVFDIKTDEISAPTPAMNQYYNQIVSQKGQIIISSAKDNSGESAFNISKSLIDIQTGNCLGILSFDIKESLFHEAYTSVADKKNERFFIIDENGIIISSEDKKTLQATAPITLQKALQENTQRGIPSFVSQEDTLVLAALSEIGNYHIVYSMNYYEIYREALNLAFVLLLIGILVLIITVLLSNVFTRSLVRPITRLTSYVDETGKGNFMTAIPIESHDEIGFLAERFQNMNTNIMNLTTCIYNEQNQKREYELNLLQAQINPHFLYNCLDNLSSLISDHENETALSILYHVGRYYRTVLSKGRNIITIKEELNLIKDYLEIQLIKSPSLFTYSIKTDPSMNELKILKMLLQPIVENSILHGFSGYKTGRHISITGLLKENTVHITVADNGKGISEEMLSSIFTQNITTMPKHFGLKNIQERIQLKFGDAYGLSIVSTVNQGTKIMISFPKTL